MLKWCKARAKQLRVSQPFNRFATSTISAIQKGTGMQLPVITRHLPRVGSVMLKLPNGRRMALHSCGDEYVVYQLYWHGWSGYEPEMVPLFFYLAGRASTVFDVGAHIGVYTLLAAYANPTGWVYAFEPLPMVYERLQHHVRLNALENVVLIPSAVAEYAGSAEFFYAEFDGLPSSSSLSGDFMRASDEGHPLRSVRVPVLTLDRFVEERALTRVGLVKVDTESTEAAVLRGMAQVLRRDRPHIFCEVLRGWDGEGQLAAMLRPLGYRFYRLSMEGPIIQEKIEGDPVWRNYLFTTCDPDEVGAWWAAATAQAPWSGRRGGSAATPTGSSRLP